MDGQRRQLFGQIVSLVALLHRRRARRVRQRAQETARMEEHIVLLLNESAASITQSVTELIAAYFDDQIGKITRRFWTRRRDRKYWEEILWPGTEEDFKRDLRVRKDTFQLIVDEVRELVERQDVLPLNRRFCVSVEKRVAICLYFLGTTCEYPTVSRLFDVADSTVCEIVHEVCAAVVHKMQDRFIRFPVG